MAEKIECGAAGSGLALFNGYNDLVDNVGKKGKKKAVPWGDSITNQNFFESATQSQYNNLGYFIIANLQLGNPFTILNNGGVSGDRTDQILARFDADVKAYSPDYVPLLAGTNDLGQSIPLETIKTNMIALWDAIASIGAVAVVATVPANDNLPSIAVWAELNRFIVDECNARGILCADFAAATTDPNNSVAPYQYANITYDGTHPNYVGAYLMGSAWADVVRPFITDVAQLPSTPADPSNFTDNPLNTGTGGTVLSGVAPDGMQVFNGTVPAGSTLVGSIVEVDNKRKFTIEIDGTEKLTTFTRPATTKVPTAGKKYYAIAEVDLECTESDTFTLQLRYRAGAATVFTSLAMRKFADNAVLPAGSFSGIMQTPIIEAPAGTDGFIWDIFLDAFTAKMTIGRVAILEVD